MTILALIAAYALTWPALLAILFLGIMFEANDAHSWAVFSGLITLAIMYFMFSIPAMTLAIGAGLYFVIGLGWSIWRYKRHADDIVEKFKDASEYDRQSAVRDLHPKRMLSSFTTWVFIWPYSMVGNFVGDFVKMVQKVISEWFRGIYHGIYNKAVGQLITSPSGK